MTPGIPYVELAPWVLVPSGAWGTNVPELSIKPFGVLVALGVSIGAWNAISYGARRGMAAKATGSFVVWVVSLGFVFGHVLDVVFYSPERLREEPWVLLRLWDGLSSFGGFAGGVVGAYVWGARHRSPVLPYADVVASALPLGWVFGRAGCAVVHDHPGVRSDAWFAVQYPDGGRLDLGLLEMVFVSLIAVAFALLRRRAWPWGFFVGALSVAYAPVRFLLDFFRLSESAELEGPFMVDRRYAELTPAQWGCLVLLVLGAALLMRALRSAGDDHAYRAPAAPLNLQPALQIRKRR